MIEYQILEKLASIEQMLIDQKHLQKEVLTLVEAASYLQVSASHIYKMTSGGILPHYCPTGKKLYFKRTELDEWLLTNRQETNVEIEKQAINYLIKNKRSTHVN